MINDLFTGKLRSMKDDLPVLQKILERLPATLALNITAILLSLTFGTLLGIYAARHAGRWKDLLSSLLTFFFIALPEFWISYLIVIAIVYYVGIPFLGTCSYGINFPNHLSLPLFFPGLAILITSLAFYLVGDGLREAA